MKNQICTNLSKAAVFLLMLIFSQSYLQAQPGTIDPTFNIGTGPNHVVNHSAIQSDGKIIIVGLFTSYNGTSRNGVARLNMDGSLDTGFNPGTGANNYVLTTCIQTDGKIIIGGQFTFYNGTARNYIARLNTDGSLDATFNQGTGANLFVTSIAVQSDGKIIIGGQFTYYNGTARNRIARLNTDGSLDTGFNPGTGAAGGVVYSTPIQSDGKIIIGGQFTSYNGTVRNNIARLNTDGSLDAGFNPGTGASSAIYSSSIQSDGKIIITGYFSTYKDTLRNHIARLNTDGSLDTSFNPGTGANLNVFTSSTQTDGKIIIGGQFTSYNGTARNRIARLNTDGSLDAGFNPGTGTNSDVMIITKQNDGNILVGGSFTLYNSIPNYNFLIRLNGDQKYYNTIEGNIFTDSNNDCLLQTSEKTIPSAIVKALPGPYFGSSDNSGHYALRVDSGLASYTITHEYNSNNSKLFFNQCASSQTVSLTGAFKDTCCFNFADSVKYCSLLDINIQKSRARRCFRSSTFVYYSNYGNSSASGAVVTMEYPADLIPLSSSPMWSAKQGNILIYNIGTILSGQTGQINITDSIACVAGITGLTECIKATISPASNCIAQNPAWDQSSMKVTGNCTAGIAHFVISNTGSGNMSGQHEYRIYVNDSLIYTGNFQLNSGEILPIDYPAQGHTVRLEADQHPLHPGRSRPRATIENCGVASPEIRGFVSTAPQDDLDEETAITCNTIVDSYDPNDKQAMPKGIGSAYSVLPGTEIEYTIRFQNTGTDTAYTVVVVDTLDAGLDISSFTKGAYSHPYTYNISGKGLPVLSFRFSQINLPDSNANKLASNGLISFRIAVQANSAIGTVVKNKAHIFFDYNDPVITNETMHTVDTITHKNLSKGSAVIVGAVTTGLSGKKFSQATKIYPNPTNGMITVEIPEAGNDTEMRILSLVGSIRKSVPLSGTIQEINLEGLSQGMYLYEIWQNGERRAGGKLQVN
jgi:uncharacterized delta-60 repeat protein/uncharacterized repeat protein (TIGR01451 family)